MYLTPASINCTAGSSFLARRSLARWEQSCRSLAEKRCQSLFASHQVGPLECCGISRRVRASVAYPATRHSIMYLCGYLRWLFIGRIDFACGTARRSLGAGMKVGDPAMKFRNQKISTRFSDSTWIHKNFRHYFFRRVRAGVKLPWNSVDAISARWKRCALNARDWPRRR